MGTVLIKSINATEHVQDARYVNNLLNEVIDDIETKYIVQVVTNKAANMIKAGMTFIKQRPKIF